MTRSRVGNVVYYYCRTYKNQSKAACTKHTIRHDRLETAVLFAIRQQIYLTAVSYTHLPPPGNASRSSEAAPAA